MSLFKARRRIIRSLSSESLVKKGQGEKTEIRSLNLGEKRLESQVSRDQLELLYRIDGLTFRIVQKYIEKMLGAGYYIKGGSDRARKLCQEFCERIDIIYVLGEIIRDIFVTGNGTAWVELGYNEKGDDILTVTLINPKSGIDFIRDEQGNILYDTDLRPVGFQLGGVLGYPKMAWKKDEIIKEGQVVWRPRREDDDGRDRIAYFKLVGVGEEELGMSPLEPVYKAAIIRLNLEDTVGNIAFRSSAVTAYVGAPDQNPAEIPDEVLENVKQELLDVDNTTVWAFKRNVEVRPFPIPDIKNYERLMYYFADLQSSGAGIGIALILQPLERGYRGDIEIAREEFRETVRLFQRILAHQVKENFFKRLLKAKGISLEECPDFVLREREYGIALTTARRLSAYARYGLLTPDPKLEKWIREQEGLPLLEGKDDGSSSSSES